MRYFILYIFFLSALGSCKTDKVKPLSIFSDVVPEKIERDVRDMPVKGSAVDTIVVADCDLKERLHVSSWVDSITYLSLDNREEALLGAINKVVCRKDAIYLLDRYKSKSIKKFSMEGKFLTNIGTFGEAPEEYAAPTAFVVTDRPVSLSDQFTSRFIYDPLNGKYLRSCRLPFLCLRFHRFSEDNFVFCTLDADNQHLASIEDYSIFRTDSLFVIKERGFYRERGKYSSIISDYNFSELNGRLYYHSPYSGRIYEIDDDGTCRLAFFLDFGDRQVPENLLLDKNWNEYKQASSSSGYYFFPGKYLLTDDVVYFAYANHHKEYQCLYSLRRKEGIRSSVVRNDVLSIFPFSNLVGVEGHALIGYVYPNDIVVAREHYDAVQWTELVGEKAADIAKQFNEEDNMVLLWFHMKEK